MRRIFLLLLIVALFSPVYPTQAAELVRVPSKLSPKADNFIKQLENAKSFNEFKRAIGDVRFSQEEIAKLQDVAKTNPAISEKLKRLLQEEQAYNKPQREARSQALIKQKEYEYRRKQEVELERINNVTMGELRNLKASKLATARVMLPSSTSTARTTMQTQLTRPPVSSVGNIRFFSPSIATIGKSLTISGDDFGRSPGSVLIGIERNRMYCPVSSWSESQIVVMVPLEFQPFVGMEEKAGFVWVKLHGSENGPYKDVTIRPDIEGMTPKITALSTTELRPGAILLIEGENFLMEQRGTVEFNFDGKKINGIINEWHDNYIAVNMPSNTQALPRKEGMVVVKNHLSLQTIKAITFVPSLWTSTLVHKREALAIMFGYKGERDDFNIQLKNGWTVKDNSLECHQGQCWVGCGCQFVTKATPGSTLGFSRTMIWIDWMGTVYSTNYLTIEGPAGLPYQ